MQTMKDKMLKDRILDVVVSFSLPASSSLDPKEENGSR